MKRNKIIMVLALFFAFLTLTACGGNNTALTATQFKEKMAAKSGFQVVDVTKQYEGQDVKQAYIATNGTWQIEFYEQNSEKSAKTSFDINKSNFEKIKNSTAVTTEKIVGNVSRYTQVSSGKFSVISRIDNTFIYLNVDERYKNEAQEILRDLGY